MTIRLIRNKKIESTISLTKSNIFPNHLYFLINPLLNKKIKIEAECDNRNINILFNRNKRIKTSTSTYTSITFTITPTTTFSFFNDKKYKKTINKINKNIKEQDTGYIVPLNIDNKIKDLNKLIKNYEINQYPLHKYYKLNILTIVIKDFFKHEKELLFSNITNSLIFISNNFKNKLKEIYKKKKNIRNTYTINGGYWTMQGHNAYNISILDERYSFVIAFIQDNYKNQLDNFEVLKKNRTKIYKDFESNKNFNDNTDIKEKHFKYILKNKSRFEFYNYLYGNLFKLIIDSENYIANLVRYRFSEFYETFNISLPNIQTDLSFFKTFSVNFSLQEKDQNIRQGATDPHKDDMIV